MCTDNLRIVWLSSTYEGHVHDKKICDEEPLLLPKGIRLWQDTGFIGHKPDGVEVCMPKKRPKGKELTTAEKQENKRISGIRIKVEHAIGGMKKCRIVKERFRCHKFGFEDMVILIACGLHNFRISHENLTMREMPGGTLFPDTMKQYNDYTIREALHNCIAHQDYTMQQRINFVENPTYLYYSNAGTFIPGTLENALTNEEPQAYFRNECLCRAMVDFNMIDTVSRGIKKMFNEQWRRHFPMPDYEIDAKNRKVSVRIYGNEINKQYTNLLKTNDSLTLWDCISLDAVQKGRTIHEDVAQDLLNRGLIEGEAPNYTISLGIAKATRQLQGYTKQKGLDKEKIKQMILQYLKNAGTDGAKRDSIYEYVKDVMPQVKTHEQQLRLLGDILSTLSTDKLIYPKGRTWFLKE